MSAPSVSIHPYFKVHPGKMEAAQALIPRFVEKTKTETGCLFYEFTVAGDVVFCREAYTNGEAALAHLGNVDAELKEMLSYSDLERLELHGPAEELAILKAPLAGLSPTWFEYAGGLER
jgi:quinol monooxygenase YgiN